MGLEITTDPFAGYVAFKEFAEIYVEYMDRIEELQRSKKPEVKKEVKELIKNKKWNIIGGTKHNKFKEGLLKERYHKEIKERTYMSYVKLLTDTPEGLDLYKRLQKGVITDWASFKESKEYKRLVTTKIGKKPKYLARITNIVREFWEWSNHKHPAFWTEDDVRMWLVHLKTEFEPPLKISTQRNYLIAIRQFVRWGVKNVPLFESIPVDLAGKKPKPEDITYLKPDELAKTLKYLPLHKGKDAEEKSLMDRAIMLFFMTTGCRLGERNTPAKIVKYKKQGISELKRMELGLIGARLDNISWHSKMITMYEKLEATWHVRLYDQCYEAIVSYLLIRKKWSRKQFEEKIKTGIEGYLFLANSAYIYKIFLAILNNAKKDGKPITGWHVRLGAIKLGIGRDIPKDRKFSPHIFRKSFAQNLLGAGITLEVISDTQVGWRDLSTLKQFYGTTPDILKDKAHEAALTYLPNGK